MDLFIDEIEQDIIREIINISVAKAADSFAMISKDKVLINVPEIKVFSKDQAVEEVVKKEATEVIVLSDIKGDITGNSLMLFSKHHIKKLSEVCLNEPYFDEEDIRLKESLLLEVSNIITGSLVTQLANILKMNIYGLAPRNPIYLNRYDVDPILELDDTRSFLVTISTTFINKNNMIGLPLILILDLQNLNKILTLIRKNNYQNFSVFKSGKVAS